jgi:hypothetical protein
VREKEGDIQFLIFSPSPPRPSEGHRQRLLSATKERRDDRREVEEAESGESRDYALGSATHEGRPAVLTVQLVDLDPPTHRLAQRVPHLWLSVVRLFHSVHEAGPVQGGVRQLRADRVKIQSDRDEGDEEREMRMDSQHANDSLHLLLRQHLLVQEVHLLQVDAPLSETMERLSVGEPLVVRGHLLRLSREIVQHIHLQLELLVDVVPVVHDRLRVGAEADHHPGRQVLFVTSSKKREKEKRDSPAEGS